MTRITELRRPAPKNFPFICGFARLRNRKVINKHRNTRINISRNFNHPNFFASDFFKNLNVEKGIFFNLFLNHK